MRLRDALKRIQKTRRVHLDREDLHEVVFLQSQVIKVLLDLARIADPDEEFMKEHIVDYWDRPKIRTKW